MSMMHLMALTPDGRSVPVRADAAGNIAGAGAAGNSAQSGNPWNYAAASGGITDTSDVTLVAAAGVGKANYLTSIDVCNKSATQSEVVIKDGSAIIWRSVFGASMIAPVTIPLSLASSPNSPLKAACITTSTATYINARGYSDATVSQIEDLIQFGDELVDDLGAHILDDNNNIIYVQ